MKDITYRQALKLVTTLCEDLKRPLSYWRAFDDDYVEEEIGWDYVRTRLKQIDVIARTIMIKLEPEIGDRLYFSLLTIHETDDIEMLVQTQDLMGNALASIPRLHTFLRTGFPFEHDTIPVTNPYYAQFSGICKEFEDRIRPISLGAIAARDTQHQGGEVSPQNSQPIELPFLKIYYPDIAADLDAMEVERANEIKENMLGIMKARLGRIPESVGRDFLDSVVFTGFMMSGNRER